MGIWKEEVEHLQFGKGMQNVCRAIDELREQVQGLLGNGLTAGGSFAVASSGDFKGGGLGYSIPGSFAHESTPSWESPVLVDGVEQTAEVHGFELAWNELNKHLGWIQGNKGIPVKMLGKNIGEVATLLIDQAYPQLRTEGTLDVHQDVIEKAAKDLFEWEYQAQMFESWQDQREDLKETYRQRARIIRASLLGLGS